ncbi:MAG: hypothetical protein ACXWRE_03820 [Pseudobdellovibrionaceae bacterium]
MKKEDLLEAPRAARIVVMNETGEIVGTLKMIYDVGNTPLPIEKVFYEKILRPEPHLGQLFFDAVAGSYTLSKQNLSGSLVQMMEFVSTRKYLNALLLLVAEIDTWLKQDNYFTQVEKSKLPKIIQEQLMKNNFPTITIWPEEYVLYCDTRLVPYYESLGFRTFQQKGKLFAMKMSRDGFVHIVENSPLFRSSNEKLIEGGGLHWLRTDDQMKLTGMITTFQPLRRDVVTTPQKSCAGVF